MHSTDATTIGTLRIRGAVKDAPSLSLSLSSLLKNADLRPAGISPSAILIVRSMKDPLPRRIVHDSMHVNADWERAVQNALSGVYRQAARPVAGYIPPNASAVLFVDEGEMLACLALDMSHGEAWGHWWWKFVIRDVHQNSSEGLLDLLCSRAEYFPSALRYLVDRGLAFEVINYLSPEQAMTVVSAMSRCYGAVDLGDRGIIHTDIPGNEEKSTRNTEKMIGFPEEKRRSEKSHVLRSHVRKDHVLMRWLPPIPVMQRIGRERTYLMAIGLALFHEPSIVRTTVFLQDIREWWVNLPFSTERRNIHEKTSPITGIKAPGYINGNDTAEIIDPQNATIGHPGNKTTNSGSTPIIKAHIGNNEFPQEINSLSPEQGNTDIDGNSGESITGEELTSIGQDTSALPYKTQAFLKKETVNAQKAWDNEGVVTQLGGVLYLINLMRHLGLPGCFEDELALSSQVGAWGVLEILGRTFAMEEYLSDDPLWKTLAELDSRGGGELPGGTFRGSDSFHIPPAWFNNQAEVPGFYWEVNQDELYVWTENYLVTRCPRNTSLPQEQASEELRAYFNGASPGVCINRLFDNNLIENIDSPLVEGLNPGLKRWLSMVIPFIRSHLRQALNQKDSEPDILKSILLGNGTLYVTSTHVDLVMSMEKISIRARLAGLDRDPGWVADFGRVVKFHFE